MSKRVFPLAVVALVVILIAAAIPTVSANIIINETLDEYTDTSEAGLLTFTSSSYIGGSIVGFYIKDVALFDDISYFTLELSGEYGRENGELLPAGRYETTYTYAGVTKPAVIYISRSTNFLGQVVSTKYILFPQNWDRYNLAGSQAITTPIAFYDGQSSYNVFDGGTTTTNIFLYNSDGKPAYLKPESGSITPKISHATAIRWVNHLTVTNDIENIGYEIKLDRTSAGINSQSTISIYNYEDVIYTNTGLDDIVTWFPRQDVNTINVTSPSRCYTFALVDDSEDYISSSVTIYVRNSQTGALLANANIDISASVNGTLHEVVNETAPSGIYSIDLQPTGGGLPNPDFYRLWVTLDGYNSQMPYMDFDVSGGTSVYVYMEPTGEPPVDENMTFVEFYVRDIYANPLANADVSCGGYTLKTNSAGYTQFELPKNAVYSYSVSKIGYMTIEGIATVENDGRYTVNVALMAGAVPTHTAATPTITVEPTPTQTTPPIQEDNLIGLAVKGLAKGFGIDYDTALLLFGLMIVFGAGGIVMSSVKGGAMEFIAGSIVGTFVAFALGLIPIWIFIIIAVVFGAYVLRVFLQGGQ